MCDGSKRIGYVREVRGGLVCKHGGNVSSEHKRGGLYGKKNGVFWKVNLRCPPLFGGALTKESHKKQ